MLAYIDGVLLICPTILLQAIWAEWKRVLLLLGLSLNQAKCESWVPNASQLDPEVNSIVQHSMLGLELMGNAIEDDLTACLGPFARHDAPMRKRMAIAIQLHAKLTDILNADLECNKIQPVLALTMRLLARKPDYDARVSSFAHLSEDAQPSTSNHL